MFLCYNADAIYVIFLFCAQVRLEHLISSGFGALQISYIIIIIIIILKTFYKYPF